MASSTPLAEHTVISLRRATKGLPRGAQGTIVSVYAQANRYLVEFVLAKQRSVLHELARTQLALTGAKS